MRIQDKNWMTVTVTNPWEQFRRQVIEALQLASGQDLSQFLEIPADPHHGDLACTAAFHLAQELKKTPVEIAKGLVKFDPIRFPLIEQVVAQGPYVNFYINIIPYRRLVIDAILTAGDSYGSSNMFAGKHVVVEYPAVNPNNPLHVGHARNAVLGDTVARLMRTVGYDVTRMDYINDLGLQIAVAYWALKHLDASKYKGKYDHIVGRLYVDAQGKYDEDQVRKYLKLMEQGNNKVASEVRKMSERVLRAHHKTHEKLNVHHDLLVWESDIAHSGLFAEALEKILEAPTTSQPTKGEKAGCVIVDLSLYEEFQRLKDTEKVLVRSDGVATYTGKDIAFHFWKFGIIEDPFKYTPFKSSKVKEGILWTTAPRGETGHYRPADIIYNVIGMPQSQAQRTVYLILKTLGYEKASENYYHLAYEFVTLPDARFSGRKGTWIGLSTDDVIRQATRRAVKEVKKRNPDADSRFLRQVAKAIGSAAVRYSLLKVAVEKQIVFTWEDMLNFDGNAAPYLMYTYARACSILRKETAPTAALLSELTSPFETELVKLLGRFPEVLLEIVQGTKREVWGTRIELFHLAEYAYTLCVAFNSFYNNCPVLKAETPDLKAARLLLVQLSRQVLSNALQLLGITPLERM
ncbi:MAG: arginine--tRNA ligase [Candidatus Hodarchaeota archaeon]